MEVSQSTCARIVRTQSSLGSCGRKNKRGNKDASYGDRPGPFSGRAKWVLALAPSPFPPPLIHSSVNSLAITSSESNLNVNFNGPGRILRLVCRGQEADNGLKQSFIV